MSKVGSSEQSRPQSLDDIYGSAVHPFRIDPQEAELQPRSIHLLNDESGELLRRLTELAKLRLGVAAYVYCELPILWVVDELGEIRFALEEIVHIDTHDFALPRLRDTEVKDGFARLGHPSLVGAKPARIGGEILFDVRANTPKWVITNGSGRYGIGHDRTELHLDAVRQRFLAFGIDLEPFYILPRGMAK